jgi:HEAT repeat protein
MNYLSIRLFSLLIAAFAINAPSATPAAPAAKGAAPSAPPVARTEAELIAVLASKAPAVKKNGACRELKTIGTEKSIPALAALLTDKDLSHPARFALESMPYPAAGAALRKAVGKTSGRVRAGIIDSLGERRDAAAVAVIAPALADTDKQVVAAAAWGLGKIGTVEAAAALLAAFDATGDERRATIGQGLVLCERNLARAGKTALSFQFLKLSLSEEPKNVRSGALAGIIRAAGPKKVETIRHLLAGDDPLIRAACAAALPDLTTDDLAKVAIDLQKLPVAFQVSILSAVRIRGDRKLLDVALDGLTSPYDEVRLAAVRALGSVGDSSALPKLLGLAAKGGPAADAARQSIAALPGQDVDPTVVSVLRAEKDAKLRAEYVGVVAARRFAGAAAVLLEEAKYPDDAAVRGRAMAELTPLAAPKDLTGLIEGVLAAEPGKEREEAERTIVRVMQQVREPAKRAELVIAAINSSSGDHLALLPLIGRFGGKVVAGMVESGLAGSDPHVKQFALRALCNWPDATVADELFHRTETCADPADRTMLLMAYTRVVSMPKQGTDAMRLERLKRAMALALHDEERAYVLKRAGAVRSLDSLRFVLPYVDRPAVAESACKAVADLAHHRELRDPHKAEFQAALEKVQRTSKDRGIRERVKGYLDSMHSA